MEDLKSTILIVDDDAAGREAIVSILQTGAYELVVAENGFQALELAKSIHPDIILLDVMMPGMDGFEVCRRIRSDATIAEVPILFLTALDDRQSLLNGLDAGGDDFISKPPDRYELRARVLSISRLNRYRKLLDERKNIETAHQQLLLAYDKTIAGWSHAMDLRDKETEGHSQRVTEMTVRMAQMIGITGDALLQIRRGAMLHDIGKLGVPDAILLKTAALSDEEWKLMRQHPQMAYDMLYPIEYLRPAVDIPYYHHEKWDGSGYPHGFQGEEIPLAARLFSIVDVWDAITSDRPYRAAWSFDKALAYIQEQSGKHFEPEMVKLFIKMLNSFLT